MKQDNVLNHIPLNTGVPVIINSTKSVPGGNVVVAWEPPLTGACPVVHYTVHYREEANKMKTPWQSVTVKGNSVSYTLQLKCRKKYELAVTSLSGYKESAFSDSKIWKFKTDGGDVA